MEWFTVKYRQPNGTMTEAEFEAADRSSLFNILAAKNIVAVTVRQGRIEVGSRSWKNMVSSREILALLCFVLLIAVIVSILSTKGRPPATKDERKERVVQKEIVVHPRRIDTASHEAEITAPAIDPNARPTKTGEIVNGYVKLASGRIHKIRGAITNDLASIKADYEIFDHYSENEIACLLTIKPGDTIVDMPNYRGRLKADFIESLEHPIMIYDSDSEADKELKIAVLETKKELKEALDRGEDIEKIILESREESRRLAEYKRLLKSELLENAADREMSAQDFQDLVDAANIMLAEKGIAPLKATPIMKRKLMLSIKKEDQ